jgi:hypothetical protein
MLGPLLLLGGMQTPDGSHMLPVGQSALVWHETGAAMPPDPAPDLPQPATSPLPISSKTQASRTPVLHPCPNDVNITFAPWVGIGEACPKAILIHCGSGTGTAEASHTSRPAHYYEPGAIVPSMYDGMAMFILLHQSKPVYRNRMFRYVLEIVRESVARRGVGRTRGGPAARGGTGAA